MPGERTPAGTHERPRPLTVQELLAKLDDLHAAVGGVAHPSADGAPCPLATKDLLRCLAPLTSLN